MIFIGQIGEDPFLTGITDHTRQESGDSGLSVSMSHTPDFLSSIDDSMDGLSGKRFFKSELCKLFEIVIKIGATQKLLIDFQN